jgi:hypothetical protein
MYPALTRVVSSKATDALDLVMKSKKVDLFI